MRTTLNHLPHAPGVYLMRDQEGKIIYVGKAKDLRKRVSSYFHHKTLTPKLNMLLSIVQQIDYRPASSESDALLLEQKLIHRIQPFYNTVWRDDKSYPYIKLTLDEDFPRLFLTRKRGAADMEAHYFGPYPNVSMVKKLLRTLWQKKIFPLRPCRFELNAEDSLSEDKLKSLRPVLYRKVSSCIYLHTKECPAPCIGRISRKNYRKIAAAAELFFKGKIEPLQKKWEKEMKDASRHLNYERAAELRNQIAAISHISENVIIKAIEMKNLTAEQARNSRGTMELQEKLGLKKPPLRIEAFDVSNIQGTEPVASLVVFERGEPCKKDYRKFKIKTVRGQNDFAMMAEAVHRRYRRVLSEGTQLPDLILVDGGKGQLSAASNALGTLWKKTALPDIPLISIAKENEEVFIPGRPSPILFSKDSPALHILQRTRDEAHRFAIAFHRKRRDKKTLSLS